MNICSRILALFFAAAFYANNIYAQLEDGDYYLQNVATNLYLGGANSNGTVASIIEHGQPMTLNMIDANGFYSIDSHIYSSSVKHYLGSSLSLDSPSTYWKITEVSDGIYTLTCDDHYYLSSDNSTVLKLASSTSSQNRLWRIISEEKRKNSLKAGDDATFLLRGAGFSNKLGPDYKESYWKIADATNSSDVNLSIGNGTDNCAIAYHTTFDVYQVLENIPNGTYSLTAQAFYRQDGSRVSYSPEIYMNDECTEFLPRTRNENSESDACNSFADKLYKTDAIKVTTYNGTLRIGARLEKNNAAWCCWDNMVLTYVSDLSAEEYQEAIVSSISTAKELLNADYNRDVKYALQATIDEKENVADSLEAYKEYANLLNYKISEANRSIAIYNKVLDVYNENLALDKTGQEVYRELSKGIYEKFENGEITDGRDEMDSLNANYIIAAKAQIADGSDMTVAIVNPTIDGSDGWTAEKPNGGNGPMLNNCSFEYWAGPSIDEDDRSFNYYQTITGLHSGTYSVTCSAYNSMNGTSSEYNAFSPSSGIYATSGGVTVKTYVDVDGTKFNDYETPNIYVGEDGTLTIGVKNFNTMAARWFVADNFRLTLIQSDPEYTIAVGINGTAESGSQNVEGIYSISGQRLDKMQKGINIIRYSGGKAVKRIVK